MPAWRALRTNLAPRVTDKVIDMNTDPRKPLQQPEPESESGQGPDVDHLSDALDHISSAVETNSIARASPRCPVASSQSTAGIHARAGPTTGTNEQKPNAARFQATNEETSDFL